MTTAAQYANPKTVTLFKKLLASVRDSSSGGSLDCRYSRKEMCFWNTPLSNNMLNLESNIRLYDLECIAGHASVHSSLDFLTSDRRMEVIRNL